MDQSGCSTNVGYLASLLLWLWLQQQSTVRWFIQYYLVVQHTIQECPPVASMMSSVRMGLCTGFYAYRNIVDIMNKACHRTELIQFIFNSMECRPGRARAPCRIGTDDLGGPTGCSRLAGSHVAFGGWTAADGGGAHAAAVGGGGGAGNCGEPSLMVACRCGYSWDLERAAGNMVSNAWLYCI